jgi:hypothetical protein
MPRTFHRSFLMGSAKLQRSSWAEHFGLVETNLSACSDQSTEIDQGLRAMQRVDTYHMIQEKPQVDLFKEQMRDSLLKETVNSRALRIRGVTPIRAATMTRWSTLLKRADQCMLTR